MFVDTADFRLYNNSFILTPAYRVSGRIPDRRSRGRLQVSQSGHGSQAASVDVRPKIAGPYRVKFKSEALPLKDQVGGFRLLYSHNCIFPAQLGPRGRSHEPQDDRAASARGRRLDRRNGRQGRARQLDARRRGADGSGHDRLRQGILSRRPISRCGARWATTRSCAASLPTKRSSIAARTFTDLVKARVEELFIKLQLIATGWLYLGTTKTGLVYRLKGNPPQAHE